MGKGPVVDGSSRWSGRWAFLLRLPFFMQRLLLAAFYLPDPERYFYTLVSIVSYSPFCCVGFGSKRQSASRTTRITRVLRDELDAHPFLAVGPIRLSAVSIAAIGRQ